MALNALDRHLALVGFMGVGKTTMARELSTRLLRPIVDIDGEIEARYRETIPQIFAARGEPVFRRVEAYAVGAAVERRHPSIIDLGGGAVTLPGTRDPLADAFTVLLDIDVDTAVARPWQRSPAGEGRAISACTTSRRSTARSPTDRHERDIDGVILAAAGIHHEVGALELLGEHGRARPVALVADST
jgi:shikimate kinase